MITVVSIIQPMRSSNIKFCDFESMIKFLHMQSIIDTLLKGEVGDLVFELVGF